MSYQVKQEKFEGPLALLFELIEKEKLSITEISLGRVADDYVKYVKRLGKIDPEELGEFLVVAAQLMLIKSRSLLPSLTLDEEEKGSIEDLQRRLEEYKRIKDLAKDLKREEGKKFIFSREAFMGVDPVFYPPPKLTLDLLVSGFRSFFEALPKIEKLAEEKIKKIISLQEKINHIRAFLSSSLEHAFSDLVRGSKEKVEVIVSFLAILELAKQRFVDLDQKALFEDIKIKRLDREK